MADRKLSPADQPDQAPDQAPSAGELPGASTFVANSDDLPELAALGTKEALQAVNGDRRWLSEIERTKAALDAEPKVPVRLPQRKPPKQPLPAVTCQVNDYTYSVPRGVVVHVPESVHLLLSGGGYLDID